MKSAKRPSSRIGPQAAAFACCAAACNVRAMWSGLLRRSLQPSAAVTATMRRCVSAAGATNGDRSRDAATVFQVFQGVQMSQPYWMCEGEMPPSAKAAPIDRSSAERIPLYDGALYLSDMR